MWQNWKPNFPSYSFELTAGDQSSTAYTILKTIFRCQEIVLEKYNTSSSFDAKIKWNGSQLTLLNARVRLKYPENTYKMIKFKNSSGDEVRVSMTAMEIYDGHNNKLDIGDWVFGGSYAVAWGELGGKKNEIILTKPINNNNEITFNYIAELGLEDYNEPYYWDNKEWTPNQLKFSSIVKYSNILTEDNIDSGDATLLPVTSSSANASSYEQDENGNCYVKDSEGNIVYNKLLNKLARKTKINNGYRINGDQSLELLSFGNNIYDINQKTEGQFLFSGNKKQKYGLKKDDKVNSILQQNIPYFGGQPAIYPVVVYNNTNQMLFDNLSITKTSNKITVNQIEYDLKEQDLLVAYIREHGEWIPKKGIGVDNSDSSIKYWSFQKGSVYTNHRIAILSSGTNSAELKFSPMKTYNIQNNITFTWNGQSIPSAFNEISLHDFFYTNIIVPENKTIQIPIKNVSDFSMFTTLTHYDSACSIGNYNYEKGYKNLSWNNHCNFSMTVTLKDFSTIQINPTEVNEYDIGTAAKEEQTTTGDIYAFTDAEGRGGLSRYYQHIAILQGNLKSAPGTFPLRCNYFNGDNKKTILSNTYGHEEYFEASDAYSVFPSLIKVNDKEYSYNYHYDNTEDTSSTLVDVDHLSLYLNFTYLNTTYKKYAIAIVIWKNGKLLKNS